MDRRTYLSTVGGVTASVLAGCTETGTTGTGPNDTEKDGRSAVDFSVEKVVEGVEHPWGIAFLPDDPRLLVTERDAGRLRLIDRESGDTEAVDGTPEVHSAGQGGLLDVTLHPEFPDESWVYLTYAAANGTGESSTHLGRGRLDLEVPRISAFEELHVADPFVDSNAHYGSRIVFGPDGFIYLTVGDRQFKDFGPNHVAQDTTNELGTTLRIAPDGSVPDDNPFINEVGVRDTIYSYGHRNPQGMAVHPETGEIWQSEHGEQDGDEINIVERGGNHGWPIATYACTYEGGEPIGDSPDERDDLVAPAYHWECGSGGFPPSGATFYTGDAFPEWRGDLFVGNLAGRYLGRFSVDGRDVEALDQLLVDRGRRIRVIEDEPDSGHLYVAVDADSAPVLRLVPD